MKLHASGEDYLETILVLQKGWLQGMANGGRITLFLQGKALAIHAVLLSAP